MVYWTELAVNWQQGGMKMTFLLIILCVLLFPVMVLWELVKRY